MGLSPYNLVWVRCPQVRPGIQVSLYVLFLGLRLYVFPTTFSGAKPVLGLMIDCTTISLYSIALYFLGPYLPSFSNGWLNASWPSRWLVPINIVLYPHLMCNLTTNKTRLTHSLPQVVLQRAPMLFSIFITFELLVTCDLII